MASFFKPNFEKEGKGIGKGEKIKPVYIRFFKVFTSRFWQLVMLNLMYVFACLPIFTIGPATAGFNYVLRNYSQGKPVYILNDFMEKCKENFIQGLLVTVLDAIIGFILFISLTSWSGSELPAPSWLRPLALAFTLFVLYILISTNFYIFSMMVSFNLKFKQLVRNSIILGMYKLGRNLIMIIFNGLIFLLCLISWPLSLPMVLLLTFSLCALFNNFVVYPIFIKHIAEPEDKKVEVESIFKDRH